MRRRKKMRRSGTVAKLPRLVSSIPAYEPRSIEERLEEQEQPTLRVLPLTMHEELEKGQREAKRRKLIHRWLSHKRGR